jgi:UDP-glucose 4-epimerase
MKISRLSNLQSQRVVVSGGAGFVGSHIVDELLANGHQVLVVDNLSTGRFANLSQHAEFACIDIADTDLWTVMRQFQPNVVVHAAAQASVPVSMEQPQADARSNILGSLNLIQAALNCGVQQFLYINTGGALYGHPSYLPIDESHPVQPISPYGLSKWTAEHYLRLLSGDRMEAKILRLANVYGPRQSPDTEAGVISVFAARMLEDEPVTIHGDGQQSRDFVYVGDVAGAVAHSVMTPGPFTVHISSGHGTTIRQVFQRLAEATGYRHGPNFGPERPGDIRHSVLSNSLAGEVLGWAPAWTLQSGIEATIAALDVSAGAVAVASGGA